VNILVGKRLTESGLNLYRQDGILFPIPVLDEHEIVYYRACLEKLEIGLGGSPRSHELGQCHLFFAWAYRLVSHPRILDVVEDVIGPDIVVHATSIFQKRPYDATFVSWHQDGYYLGLDQPDFVSAWVALTDSNEENGCLRVVRTSHQSGGFPHGNSAASQQNLLASGLEIAVAVEASAATNVVLRPGEMSLHHVNIVHGSNPNHSGLPRVGFAIRYVAPHVVQARPHFPVVLVRGKDGYSHFKLKDDPPGDDFEQSLGAFREFSAKLTARRQASGWKK
jgi:non-heme Fe2+,alpha-ketoglutarate-dependent halogenase